MKTSRTIPESHPLHRLFRGLTESTFMAELGIGDPTLVGYVAELLASFVPSQAIWRIRDQHGQPLAQVTRMVAEAESAGDENRRGECHRHVGDYTLFWTGVYPEALAKLQGGRLARLPDQLSAAGKAVVLPGQHADGRRRPWPRPAAAERPVRALRLRPLARPPRVGEDRGRGPGVSRDASSRSGPDRRLPAIDARRAQTIGMRRSRESRVRGSVVSRSWRVQ